MSNYDKQSETERRLSPQEYEDALVRLEKSSPDLVDEVEFRRRLQQTTIQRYQVAIDLLNEVESAFLKITPSDAESKKTLELAVSKIDRAVVQLTHGALKFNKGATSAVRNVLVVKRDNDTRSAEARMAAILGMHDEDATSAK